MNEKENEKVTRRKFLEGSSKKAVVGTAAAFFGLCMVMKPKSGLATSCSDCLGSCVGDCASICIGSCAFHCSGDCANSCSGTCYAQCSGTSSPSG
jgi:hypothetical protein